MKYQKSKIAIEFFFFFQIKLSYKYFFALISGQDEIKKKTYAKSLKMRFFGFAII